MEETGLVHRTYENATLNINISVLLGNLEMPGVKEKIEEDPWLQQLILESVNYAEMNVSAHVSFDNRNTGSLPNKLFLVLGVLVVLVAGISFRANITEGQCKAVKIVKCLHIGCCFILGVLTMVMHIIMLAGKYDSHTAFSEAEGITDEVIEHLLFETGIICKVLMIAYKMNTAIVYIFQNVMIFSPFFFRQNRKLLSKILASAVVLQSGFTTFAFSVWSIMIAYLALVPTTVSCRSP